MSDQIMGLGPKVLNGKPYADRGLSLCHDRGLESDGRGASLRGGRRSHQRGPARNTGRYSRIHTGDEAAPGKTRNGFAVFGLDRITGNINLKEYYVRLRGNGEIAFIEDFEDGKHVDLFDMREYKPSWVHATVKKKKDEDGTEELQTGLKYLVTIGRTDKLFGDTPNDLVNGCICGDDGGGPKAFNVF